MRFSVESREKKKEGVSEKPCPATGRKKAPPMSTLTGRLALKDVVEQGWKQFLELAGYIVSLLVIGVVI